MDPKTLANPQNHVADRKRETFQACAELQVECADTLASDADLLTQLRFDDSHEGVSQSVGIAGSRHAEHDSARPGDLNRPGSRDGRLHGISDESDRNQ